MSWALSLAGTVLLFLVGLRLSAFFSGSETGFYRLSYLRLNLDAQSGDPVAARLAWYARNPAHFVATTLIGNNVANYMTTLAIGMFTAMLIAPRTAGWLEVLATLAMTPVIFLFGELLPKNLYYRAPMYLLRKDARWFDLCFHAFRVISWPLVLMTRLLERIGNSESAAGTGGLGRSRLVQVLSEGHRQGLLADVQSRLIHGVLHTASASVTGSVTPVYRILGVSDLTSREEILEYARAYAIDNVLVYRGEREGEWYGYIRSADLLTTAYPASQLIREIPRINSSLTRLETLLELRRAESAFGLVYDGDQLIGTISESGLIEQLFRSPYLGATGVARAG